LDGKQLVPLNVNLVDAVTMVLGKLPQIMPYREPAQGLAGFDVGCFDELGAYARAAGHAHTLWRGSSEPVSDLAALVEEGTALRALLLADIAALRLHRLIPTDSLAPFDARVGFKKLGFDLMMLAGLLWGHWAQIEHKIPLERADLDRANLLSDRIINAVGAREEGPRARAAAAEQRLRNFTLLVRAYEEVRRAIGFFHPKRRELEKIAPSLYTERQRKRRKPSASVQTPPVEPALPSESPAGAESHVAMFAPPTRLLPARSAPHPQPVLSDSRDT
jgi:hypothetical protein